MLHMFNLSGILRLQMRRHYPEITYILPYSAYTIYVGTPFFYFSCASYFMLHPTPTPTHTPGGKGGYYQHTAYTTSPNRNPQNTGVGG